MENLAEVFNINTNIIFRILLATFLGFAIGFERELTNKFAGLRTHMLVTLGACIFSIISYYGFNFVSADGVLTSTDPSRVAAQIITGIGFIGGGTVLRNGNTVIGLTTASTLWISAAIGMACGVGMFSLALFTTAVAVLVLVFIRWFENKVLAKNKAIKRIKVKILCENQEFDKISAIIDENFKSIHKLQKIIEDEKVTIEVLADLNLHTNLREIYNLFTPAKGITSINVREVYE